MSDTCYIASPSDHIVGSITLPGDKSISHRALLCAALADGITHVERLLLSDDIWATITALRSLGVDIQQTTPEQIRISGVGLNGLIAPSQKLYLGNSGTSARLLCGILAGQPFTTRLCGDASLSTRPMERVAAPLRSMGVSIAYDASDTLPLSITGKRELSALDYALPVPSAQVKSALLFAALYANGTSRVHGCINSRDHTERLFKAFSVRLEQSAHALEISGQQRLRACDVIVPEDISSAAFFMVAATIATKGDVRLTNVGINPTRYAVIHILKAMGADITLSRKRMLGTEPVADLRIRNAALEGIALPQEWVENAIDELPAVMIAAASARGVTEIRGAAELRVKESDRIQSMLQGLQTLGVRVEEFADGVAITGGSIGGGDIDSYGDHRVAMSFAVASLRATRAITIRRCNCVRTSFPGFTNRLQDAGVGIEERPE